MTLPSSQVANAYCGGYHTFLTVKDSGDVYATGLNNYGQLGIGDAEPRYEPTLVHTLKGVNIVSISVRRTRRREVASRMWLVVFFCFSRRCVACFAVVLLQGGLHSSAALTDEGRVFVWGRGDNGQLGITKDKAPVGACWCVCVVVGEGSASNT